MATRVQAEQKAPAGVRAGRLGDALPRARAGWRLAPRLAGLLAVAAAAWLAAALASWRETDPSLNWATAQPPANLGGAVGALVADALVQVAGPAAWVLVVLTASAGLMALILGRAPGPARLLPAGAAALVLAAVAVEQFAPGGGGVLGFLGWRAADGADAVLAGGAAGAGALALMLVALWPAGWRPAWRGRPRARSAVWASARRPAPSAVAGPPGEGAADDEPAPAALHEPADDLPAPVAGRAAPRRARATPAQPALSLGDRTDLPPIDLLAPAPPRARATDAQALEQNARMLETVLEDYGVRGQIAGLAQGPVVTLYELEPAAGLKASRVMGLSDDIARSMSAVSARVATIPGRSVIGIELPNHRRETVYLSELIGSAAFQGMGGTLPIVLGKDIAGDPVVADLAPMPHLLIAGTTGSGKSVGLNAMILSLLYRLRPEQCRMILIDPKMLELSVYDGIPHLLAPVVTEPHKAIRALKWAVEQMEERYRLMAHVNVRSLAAYNERVAQARRTGQPFIRQVQTGWDADGAPVFEEITLPLDPLPLVVVVVDELADLMMTAGKEVEYLIQRLAQKARAAGIHLIMATQRPSVDVITGVIKANLPTRISFQVTSKIDSRTILGEQGAEQLLGRGDMLYMPGGKQVVRVHGPFVSDEEVEAVADHWRGQGRPDYVEAVTEEPLGPDPMAPASARGGGERDELLDQAIRVVATSRKATISYLQRQLRVGYNSAARLIEQMEEMGLVSSPDHVGRREVLMDEAGNRP